MALGTTLTNAPPPSSQPSLRTSASDIMLASDTVQDIRRDILLPLSKRLVDDHSQ